MISGQIWLWVGSRIRIVFEGLFAFLKEPLQVLITLRNMVASLECGLIFKGKVCCFSGCMLCKIIRDDSMHGL